MSHDTIPNGRLQMAASAFATAGLSVIPIGSLEDKSPALDSWKPYTLARASQEDAVHWFVANGRPASPGLGLVCGAVSGGLTVLDFDTRPDGTTLFEEWLDLVMDLAPDLPTTLPLVGTPSGGRHVYFRCDVVEGNTKLAESATRQTWIETRGEGGYVLAPPTPGYERLFGRISEVPTISMAERALLLNAARSLTAKPPVVPRLPDDCSPLPGDAFNARASVGSVVGMLTAQGWTIVRQSAEAASLRRPGKDKGISATVRQCNGTPITYAFSTNAAPLPCGEGLSPFAVYTHLNHGGDYSHAARALAPTKPGKAAKAAPVVPAASADEPFEWEKLIFSGQSLRDMEFAPIDWVVDGVIPPGLTLIAGSPKSGKSLLGWNVAIAVATGGRALGMVQVKQRRVLYLMLEDGKRLVQKRMRRMSDPGADLSNIDCAQGWRKLTEGGTEAIGQYCAKHPGALVVVDTYESLRGNGEAAHDSYRNDYAALKPLADLAHAQDLNILIIHHTNKRGGEDPFMSINGSNGISGVADTLGVLQRRNDGDDAVLHLRGRDLDCDMSLSLAFDPLTGAHQLLGETDAVGKNQAQQSIVSYLKGKGGDASPIEIARATDRENDKALLMQLGRMVDAGTLAKTDWGRYTLPTGDQVESKGNRGNTSPSADCESPTDGVQGCVTSVTFVTSPEEEPAAPAPQTHYNGVPVPVQAAACPGCGKKYHKVLVPSGDGALWCRNCGVGGPME